MLAGTRSGTTQWSVASTPDTDTGTERLPSSSPSTTTRTSIELIGAELEDRYGRAYQIVTARAVATAP